MMISLLRRILCAALFISSSFVFAEPATLVAAVGKVEVNRNNTWVALSEKATIREGEVISTGFKSEATIRYKGSVMKIGPLTRITLEKLASTDSKDDVSVFLNTGSVRSTVNHAENKRVSYTVRNPIAVASVRGTDFEFNGAAGIRCFEGGVVVLPAAFVDPVRDLGVGRPADRNNGSADEGYVQVQTEAPADGESNSYTNTKDVNPNLPKGVLLVAGQQTDFRDKTEARSAKAMTQSEEAVRKMTEGVFSASDNETVVTGAGAIDSITDKTSSIATGRVIVTLKWD